jgi:hypothetical protein
MKSYKDESLMERDYRYMRNAALFALLPGWAQALVYVIVGVPLMIVGTLFSLFVITHASDVPPLFWMGVGLFFLTIWAWFSFFLMIIKFIKALIKGVTLKQIATAIDENSGSPTVEKAVEFMLEFDKVRNAQMCAERAKRPQRII